MDRIAVSAKELKLPVFREELSDFLTLARNEQWSYEHLICEVFDKKISRRHENQKKQRIKKAHFPQMKYLSELERDELPKDAQTVLPVLETLDFIREGRNAVLSAL